MNKFLTILGLVLIIVNTIEIAKYNYFFSYWIVAIGCWLFISGFLEELEIIINNK